MEVLWKIVGLGITFCILIFCIECRVLDDGDSRKIDRFLLDTMNCGRIPALNLALVREGQIIYTKGYGTADSRDNSRTADSTLFCISSLTESFTALTLAKLLSRNESYSWDTPVKDILDDDFRLGNTYITNHLTLRDLVSHRTGLAGGDGILLTDAMGRRELQNRLFFMQEVTGFRAQKTESNVLYELVQEVLERIGEKPWATLVREHVLNPIGMTSSKFLHEATPQFRKFAMPMLKVNGNLTHVPWEAVSTIDKIGSVGSLCSTAYDMAKWLYFHLQEGRNPRGHVVLPENLLQETYRQSATLGEPFEISSGGFNQPTAQVTYSLDRTGLGWDLGYYRGYKILSKSGSWAGYETLLTMIPSRNVGVYTSFTGQMGQKAVAIKTLVNMYSLDTLLDTDPWVDEQRICSSIDQIVNSLPKPKSSYSHSWIRPDISPHRPLPAYAGNYGNGLYGRLQIFVSNDTRNALSMIYGQLGKYRLYPTRNVDEFYVEAMNGPLWYTTRADEYTKWGPIVVKFNSTRQEREATRAAEREAARKSGTEENKEDEEENKENNEEKEEEEDLITGITVPIFDSTFPPGFRKDFVLKKAWREVKALRYDECDAGASSVSFSLFLVTLILLSSLTSHFL